MKKETIREACIRFASYHSDKIECSKTNRGGIVATIDGKSFVFESWKELHSAFVAWRNSERFV